MATSPKPWPDSTVSASKGITGKFGYESHRKTCPERLTSCVPMGCLATPMEFLRPTTQAQSQPDPIPRCLCAEQPFLSAPDLERNFLLFKEYYNRDRAHRGLNGNAPDEKGGVMDRKIARLDDYRWKTHCRGLYQLPEAA